MGGRGLPSLALAARTTVEGPYGGRFTLGERFIFGTFRVSGRVVFWQQIE
ncbi:hypothetical protein KDH_24110 [Dictyobacter sp. S3.2.2.5]|uniref:Uncharacterized protein n=1 Tax=Dictyobacter halimunensis TaxID=3026934 RepID=A0ABQ6FT40_9CHLR|nr:hypothetical protein KDH_24110 [Dictyobacter sp. S3.2.2.5]